MEKKEKRNSFVIIEINSEKTINKKESRRLQKLENHRLVLLSKKNNKNSIEDEEISDAKKRRLSLEKLCESDLPNFISDKLINSKPFIKKSVNYLAEPYCCEDIKLDVGSRIEFNDKVFSVGYELFETDDFKSKLRISYGLVSNDFEYRPLVTEILPKNFNASKLLKILNKI
jgi:hypothetical protein